MAKNRPSRLRPLTLRLLTAPARAYKKRTTNKYMFAAHNLIDISFHFQGVLLLRQSSRSQTSLTSFQDVLGAPFRP
ncbi:hypothetical protein CCE29_03815 [Lacticaseibacillus rhamnosus]|nr:hypothetical protein B4583_01010 [Lacticaseibacillus rhamnosus]ART95153.1 hypothetical protein CCE29_03815 [Lacticaseibacillus rhamnosus]